jgi:hypothetical protein
MADPQLDGRQQAPGFGWSDPPRAQKLSCRPPRKAPEGAIAILKQSGGNRKHVLAASSRT